MEGQEKDKEVKMKRLEEALHNKSPLPSLRTYQGDMAEFIKEKNESVVSVAVKERVREEKREEEHKKEEIRKPNGEGFQISLAILLSSILLIAGGAVAFFYILKQIRNVPEEKPIVRNEIIPYDKVITLVNVTGDTLGTELGKIDLQNGISIIKITDTNGSMVATSKDLFNFLKISSVSALARNLKDDYAIGAIYQNGEKALFLVITANDFGIAFSSMLDWEDSMADDLSFLSRQTGVATTSKKLFWKDTIVKNKDTRALMDEGYSAQLAYTFLDKNTILITNNIYSIGDISSAYASRDFTR